MHVGRRLGQDNTRRQTAALEEPRYGHPAEQCQVLQRREIFVYRHRQQHLTASERGVDGKNI